MTEDSPPKGILDHILEFSELVVTHPEITLTPYIIFIIVMLVLHRTYMQKELIRDNHKLRLKDTRGYHSVMGFKFNSDAIINFKKIILFFALYGAFILCVSGCVYYFSSDPDVKNRLLWAIIIAGILLFIMFILLIIAMTSSVRVRVKAFKRFELFVANNLEPRTMKYIAEPLSDTDPTSVLMDVISKNAVKKSVDEYYKQYIDSTQTESELNTLIELIARCFFTRAYTLGLAKNMSTADDEYVDMVHNVILKSNTNFSAFNRYKNTSQFTKYINPNETLSSGAAYDALLIPKELRKYSDRILSLIQSKYLSPYDSMLNILSDGPMKQTSVCLTLTLYIPFAFISCYVMLFTPGGWWATQHVAKGFGVILSIAFGAS